MWCVREWEDGGTSVNVLHCRAYPLPWETCMPRGWGMRLLCTPTKVAHQSVWKLEMKKNLLFNYFFFRWQPPRSSNIFFWHTLYHLCTKAVVPTFPCFQESVSHSKSHSCRCGSWWHRLVKTMWLEHPIHVWLLWCGDEWDLPRVPGILIFLEK
jgi:hypothetical protein